MRCPVFFYGKKVFWFAVPQVAHSKKIVPPDILSPVSSSYYTCMFQTFVRYNTFSIFFLEAVGFNIAGLWLFREKVPVKNGYKGCVDVWAVHLPLCLDDCATPCQICDAAFMSQCHVCIHVPLCHATVSYGHQRAAQAKHFVCHTILHY